MPRRPRVRLEEPLKSRAQLAAEAKVLYGNSLQDSTLKSYMTSFRDFVDFGTKRIADYDEGEPVNAQDIVLWAQSKCASRGNAASFSQLVSAVKTIATTQLGRQEWSAAEKQFFTDEVAKTRRTIGVIPGKKAPTGDHVLMEVYIKAGVSPKRPRAYMTFLQLCVAKGFVTRPGELLGDKAALAGDCMFLPQDAEFPHGAAMLTLYDTKGLLLACTAKHASETAYAVGTGTATCPVAALAAVVQTYGLGDPARAREPLFASMNADASRKFSDPLNWLGAAHLQAREFNKSIKELCASAGMPHFTARTTRYGAATDMMVRGVAPLVIMCAGRWRSIDAITPYTSMTRAGAAHVARAFAATR